MGLIDVRRFDVTTRMDNGLLVVDDISLAEWNEWDVNLAEVIRVNALAVPGDRKLTFQVMKAELSFLASFLSDAPGAPLALRHDQALAASRHTKSFLSEATGLGMLTAAAERHYGWNSEGVSWTHDRNASA